MKKRLLPLFVLCLGLKTFSQDTIVNYLDSKDRITTNKQKAKVIQKLVKQDSSWSRTIYRLNGKPLTHGNYKTRKLKIKQGTHSYFDEDGSVTYSTTHNQNGLKEGKTVAYTKRGEKSFYGHYKNDFREGIWNFHYENGNKKARIIYKEGEVIKYDLWTIDGIEKNEKLIMERKPKYPGGMQRLRNRISSKLGPQFNNFPLRGRVIAQFYIGITGDVEQLVLTPSLPGHYQKIVVDFFKDLPKWKPGIVLNNPVRVKYQLPLKF